VAAGQLYAGVEGQVFQQISYSGFALVDPIRRTGTMTSPEIPPGPAQGPSVLAP